MGKIKIRRRRKTERRRKWRRRKTEERFNRKGNREKEENQIRIAVEMELDLLRREKKHVTMDEEISRKKTLESRKWRTRQHLTQ